MKMKRTMTIREGAEELGVSIGSAYKYARNGELPAIRVGKRFLILRDEFETLFKKTRRASKGVAL